MSGGSADYSRYGVGLGSFHIGGGFVGYAGAARERGKVDGGRGVGAGAPWGKQGTVDNQPCALAPPVLDVSVLRSPCSRFSNGLALVLGARFSLLAFLAIQSAPKRTFSKLIRIELCCS